jgi:ABC-type nitrate/sulfonate/bicarbonate transport system permease component
LRQILLPAIPIAGFFLGWQTLASLEWINPGIFPPPLTIMQELFNLLQQEKAGESVLLTHFLVTIQRLFLAAILGTMAGVTVGLVMGTSERFFSFVDPLVTLLMPIPGIAMVPLFIVWLGFGDVTIITIGAIATFFPVAYNTATGVRSVDPQLVWAARIMGAGSRRIVAHVYIPWASVYLFTGIKLGLARCWRTVIAVELIAASDWGLGFMVWDAAEHLNAAVVFGGIIILSLTYIVIERGLILPVERMTIEKWGMVHR